MIANFVLCACMLALSGVIVYQTSGYPDYSNMAIIGPDVIPNILAGLIAAFAVIIALMEVFKCFKNKEYFKEQTAGAKEVAANVAANKMGLIRIISILGMMLVYALALDTVGFEICTAVFLVASMLLCGVRNRKVLVLVPIGTIAVVYICFVYALRVSVPMLFL